MDLKVETLLGLPGKDLLHTLKALLQQYGANTINAWTDSSHHSNSLVHRLAILGQADALECLISVSCNVNIQRPDLNAPLHLALQRGQRAAAERLICLKADMELANKYHETPRSLEEQSERQYVLWHQHADLLVNLAPWVLRRIFRERWASYAGPGADIGRTILHGSQDKVTFSQTVTIRHGSTCITISEDLRGKISKGQQIWLKGIEAEVAEVPTYDPPRGRFLTGSGEIRLAAPWLAADVSKDGCLEVPRLRAVPHRSLPPGHHTFSKVRKGNVDEWDMTLLAYFCSDENCHLSQELVPNGDHRTLIRELKDRRNKAAVHLGRTEVDKETVNRTCLLIQQTCDLLVPALTLEVTAMITDIRGKTVITDSMKAHMEQRITDEQERAEFMDGQLQSASRFKKHVPPGAFALLPAGNNSTNANPSRGNSISEISSRDLDMQSDWSATRVSSVWMPQCTSHPCGSLEEMLGALCLPEHCESAVVSQCLALAAACPEAQSVLMVIRTSATSIDEVMLEEVSRPDVHKRWKERQCSVFDLVSTLPNLFDDFCLPDGMLVSGEHGRILRVSAQFCPPDGSWRVKAPLLRRAINIACAVEAVVIVSELGTLTGTTSSQARRGEYLQVSAEGDDASETLDNLSVDYSVDARMEGSSDSGPSSATRAVCNNFWPFMQQKEATTQSLLPMATEQVHHWGDGSLEMTAGNIEQVADNTSKWLWQKFKGCSVKEATEALQCSRAVLDRLESGGFEAYMPRLLLPMAELQRAMNQIPVALELLTKARKLSLKHEDFEMGFSAHQSLFVLYMRLGKVKESGIVLLGCQHLVNKERESRSGTGMEDFITAKQLFLDANQARLDTTIAMNSRAPSDLKKAHELLERTVMSISAMQGSSFRGNTSGNLAELCNLWSQVAMACGNAASARVALERELPVRRAQQKDETLAIALVNMGRVLLELEDVAAAEQHLAEAQDILQGLMQGTTGSSSKPGNQIPQAICEVHQLSARCAERRGNLDGAMAHLQAALELPGVNTQRIQEEKAALLRKQRQQQGRTAVSTDAADENDTRSVDDLADFIDGKQASKSKQRGKKGKSAALQIIKEAEEEEPRPPMTPAPPSPEPSVGPNSSGNGVDATTPKPKRLGKKSKW